MKNRGRLFGAPVVMRRKGQETDSVVLEQIAKQPGLAISEIASKLSWSNGKVDGSVIRLVSKGKATVKHYLKRGMLIKRVYPKEQLGKMRSDLEMPVGLVDATSWRDSVHVYALSRSTIGISPIELKEWSQKAFFVDCVSLKKNEEALALKLPQRISSFYQLDNSDVSFSAIGDAVLVTVESVLPVALPSWYPEESRPFTASPRELEITVGRVQIGVPTQATLEWIRVAQGKAMVTRSSYQPEYHYDAPQKPESEVSTTTSWSSLKRLPGPVEVE